MHAAEACLEVDSRPPRSVGTREGACAEARPEEVAARAAAPKSARTKVTARVAAPIAASKPAAAPRPAKGMAAAKAADFSRRLQEERRRLRSELAEMEQHQVKTEEKPAADASGYDDDLVDVATETFEREKGFALESSVLGLLEQVEEALLRIRGGTYGVCGGCGRPIDTNRLKAIPYARLCITCKEREERQRSLAR